ncbi:hypothetical protein AB4Y90_15000 [Chryseobacterium sp. 2TAF14]|uniref:hypothetical protein n=1 Tax=Chryseobacterium sp. 2TAF14 TaxID=3233007 RepID=UPI003F93B60A
MKNSSELKTNIQLELDVTIKEVDLKIIGNVTQLDDDISVTSLTGSLPHVSENISKLLKDEGEIKDSIAPFLPNDLNFGIYKISNEKESLSAFQLGARYSKVKLKGVFSKEFKLFSVAISEAITFEKMPLVGGYDFENRKRRAKNYFPRF